MKALVHFAVAACLCLACCCSQALAHHGEDHHEPPMPPPVQLPAPPPPPPPPQQSTSQTTPHFIVPSTGFSGAIAPTDTSGIGGSLGHAQGLQQKLDCTCKDKPGKHTHTPLVPTDPRYDFTGQWLTFHHSQAGNYDVDTDENNPREDITGRKIGRVVENVSAAQSRKHKEALFMPTKDAQYQREADGLMLTKGALLVKANHTPLSILMMISGRRVNAKVGGCAISMVSLAEDRPIVVNLTDKCCGACSVTVGEADSQRTIAVGTGEVVEIFASTSQPASRVVASKVLTTQDMGDGLSVQVARHHYVTTVKRYNICKCLPKEDMQRVLKTAAALLYAQHR
ncbi:MAG: hypothetical protein HY711_04170 [Candidatus Melainabacteria bacterium]|nr:hypothetical protein [Candidatus Melainabacteria bacterium]